MNYNDRTKSFSEEGKRLLIERKRIIHKAKDKLTKLKKLLNSDHNFKYTFIYVPEGKEVSYDKDDVTEEAEDLKIISEYLQIVKGLKFRAKTVTGTQNDRENSLNKFKEGKIDMLLAMKILDEGVDIPITKNAIFCSSTGNPRQFIQRRGRVLRQHPEKDFAIIHDLIVLPIPSAEQGSLKSEKKLIKDELTRVIYFSSLSRNYYDCMEKFKDIADFYELNMFAMQSELEDQNNGK